MKHFEDEKTVIVASEKTMEIVAAVIKRMQTDEVPGWKDLTSFNISARWPPIHSLYDKVRLVRADFSYI